MQQIRQDIDDINEQIKKHKDSLSDTNVELEQVNELLAAKQGEVTLKDLIENEGKREVSTTLNSDLAELQDEIARIDVRLRGLGDELKKLTNRAHTQQIKSLYRELMHRNLRLLNVTSLDEATFRNIECSIKETGSDLPRAILAYVFSILHVIKKFGSSAFCPIVIDAPNQQEQDQVNHLKMLKFTRDNLPDDAQLVLSLVDDCGIDFGGTVMDMTVKNFALSEDEYKSVAEEIAPFSDANLGL